MYKVVLLRSPALENRTWEHKTCADAQRRASALRDLHRAPPITYDDHGKTITVDGRDWYND